MTSAAKAVLVEPPQTLTSILVCTESTKAICSMSGKSGSVTVFNGVAIRSIFMLKMGCNEVSHSSKIECAP